MKSAVVYYSKSGTTKKLADKIAETLGADVFPVEPEKAYGSYFSAVVRAGAERISGNTPAYKTEPVDFSDYDVIFIGFPVWYSTLPQFFQSYLSACGISGKHVIPFATAGSGGKESSLKALTALLPDCEITDFFFATLRNPSDPDSWLAGLEL